MHLSSISISIPKESKFIAFSVNVCAAGLWFKGDQNGRECLAHVESKNHFAKRSNHKDEIKAGLRTANAARIERGNSRWTRYQTESIARRRVSRSSLCRDSETKRLAGLMSPMIEYETNPDRRPRLLTDRFLGKYSNFSNRFNYFGDGLIIKLITPLSFSLLLPLIKDIKGSQLDRCNH